MATRSTSTERILVLLEEDGEDVLEAAAEVAAHRGLPLVGLFIEDSDLLSTAGLPFAREIGLASGIPRPLAADDVARAMQERAGRLRARIDRIARERGLHAVFEVGRGRQAHAVLRNVRPQDLLVLRRGDWNRPWRGTPQGVVVQASCAVMLVGIEQHRAGTPGGPMVLIDGGEGATRALSRAIALARSESEVLSLLTVPGGAGEATRERARVLLHEHGIESRFIELRRARLDEVMRTIRRERPRMLLISRESPLLRESGERWWFELHGLPVVLVP